MFNDKFEIDKQITSQDLTTEPRIYRWVCIDQKLSEKTFYSTSFVELNALSSVFLCNRFLQCRFEASTFNFARFENCLFDSVVFEQSIFRHVEFVHCSFIKCSFKLNDETLQAATESLRFSRCYFDDCDLEELLALFEKRKQNSVLVQCLLSDTSPSNFHLENSTVLASYTISAEPEKELENEPRPEPISKPKASENSISAKSGQGRFSGLELDET